MEDLTDNPVQPENLANAPRCGAKTRSGAECRSPAVRGKRRCRMHGGTNPGAPKDNRNAWKHGNRSAEAEEQLKVITENSRILRLLDKVRQGVKLRSDEMDEIIFYLR